jgi:hypothetical protein
VVVKTATGTGQGIFINGTAAADIKGDPGSAFWSQFNFHMDSSNIAKGALPAGEFTFNGSGLNLINSSFSAKGEWEFFGIENSRGHFHPTHHSDFNFRFSAALFPSILDNGPSLHEVKSDFALCSDCDR